MSLELLLSRRSVRSYTDEPVADEAVQKLLAAAMSAPSAGNQQPWHFIVIRERETLGQVPAIHPHAQMVPQAQAAIVVCADEALEKHKGYWVQDCSAATQNLLLAAHFQALGAVWVGIYPREERVVSFRKLLSIPENIIPFALVAIGHPNETKAPAERYNPSRIHYGRW